MVIMVDGVATGLSVGPAGVLTPIETEFKVLGERHGPRVIRKRDHGGYLKKSESYQDGSETKRGGGGRKPMCYSTGSRALAIPGWG